MHANYPQMHLCLQIFANPLGINMLSKVDTLMPCSEKLVATTP